MNFPDQTLATQALWKSPALLDTACELVEAGLRCLVEGSEAFGPDDIPESFTADGVGITGSAVFMLRTSNIIGDYYGHHPESGIIHGRRRSKRSAANGRKIALYTITNRGLAEAFLRRHNHAGALQRELAL